MSYIQLSGVSKTYKGSSAPAVGNININIEKGKIVTLLGPSGCGKTTTLRMIAGFERPDSGVISVNGKVVSDDTTWIPPEERGIGMVFQDYALFPHLTVEGNVGFGLPKNKEWKLKTTETLEMVELTQFAKKYPSELSGGQQQRVALARALVRNPVAVLLDEPFSNLDTDLRICMRHEVTRIIKRSNSTGIFVTHDQKEALTISDQIILMKDGNIQQIGSPKEIYEHPKTRFVANFVGQSNIIKGRVIEGEMLVETPIGKLPFLNNPYDVEGDVVVSVRPEGFVPSDDGLIRGKIVFMEYTGYTNSITVEIGVGKDKQWLYINLSSMYPISVGDEISLSVIPHFVSLMQK